VQLTSALTSTIVSNVCKVLNIIISAAVAGTTTLGEWMGALLVCLAIGAYVYFSWSAKHPDRAAELTARLIPFGKERSGAPDAEAGKPAEVGKAADASKPTEGTPLKDPDATESSSWGCVVS